MYNDPIHKLKLQIEFLNTGIVPLSWRATDGAPAWFDINKILASLPPDEVRKMKRKFRKAWRKLAAHDLKRGGRAARKRLAIMEAGKEIPTRRAKNARKAEVLTVHKRKVASKTGQGT